LVIQKFVKRVLKADLNRINTMALQYTVLEHRVLKGEDVTGAMLGLSPSPSAFNVMARGRLSRNPSVLTQQPTEKVPKNITLLGFAIPNRKATPEIKKRLVQSYYLARKEEYSITAKGFIKQLTEYEQKLSGKRPTPPYMRYFVPHDEMLNIVLKGFKEIKMIEDRTAEDSKEAGEEAKYTIWSQDFNKEAELGMLSLKHQNPRAYDYFFVKTNAPVAKLEKSFSIVSKINLKSTPAPSKHSRVKRRDSSSSQDSDVEVFKK